MPADDRPEPSTPEPGAESVDELVGALYHELRAVAARQLRAERAGHTLQPTALVHEAYLRLSQQKQLRWESRLHFLHIASAQIRRILVDHARRRSRLKRGGERTRVTLTDSLPEASPVVDLLDLDDALDRLDSISAENRQIVEMKFFGGLTEVEIAELLEISERTVRRRWIFARSWLYREIVA